MSGVLIVAGLGRCGTSLAMSMLMAGGCPVVGNPPAFEPRIAHAERITRDTLEISRGRAMKIVDPQLLRVSLPRYCRAVWLDRDFTQQARSVIRFLRMTGTNVPENRETVRDMTSSLKIDRPKAIVALKNHGTVAARLSFEELILAPRKAAEILAQTAREALGVELDQDAMAEKVINRSARAMPEGEQLERKLLARR